jgi:CheY-like chemotaxis protein
MARRSVRICDWATASLLVITFGVAISLVPPKQIDWAIERIGTTVALIGHPQKPSGLEALVVSKHSGNSFAVSATLEPRGYQVRTVQTAEAALAEIRLHQQQIAVIVVDESMSNARSTMAAATKFCPEACKVLLKGKGEPTEVSKILFDALDQHLTATQARELRQQASLTPSPQPR